MTQPELSISDLQLTPLYVKVSTAMLATNSTVRQTKTHFIFDCRKWLTNPVRKLSQSRLDKSALDKSQEGGTGGGATPPAKASGRSPQVGAAGGGVEKKTGHSKFYLKVSAFPRETYTDCRAKNNMYTSSPWTRSSVLAVKRRPPPHLDCSVHLSGCKILPTQHTNEQEVTVKAIAGFNGGFIFVVLSLLRVVS